MACAISILRVCVLQRAYFRLIAQCKGEVIPVQAKTDPEDSRRLRLKISRKSAIEGSKTISPKTGGLYPLEYYWYSFLLAAESTPRPGIELID
jgi:hypothetical protein